MQDWNACKSQLRFENTIGTEISYLYAINWCEAFKKDCPYRAKIVVFCCYSDFLSNMLRHNLFLLCCVLCTQDQFMLHCKAVNSQNFNVSLQNIVFPYYRIIIQACLLTMFLRWYWPQIMRINGSKIIYMRMDSFR